MTLSPLSQERALRDQREQRLDEIMRTLNPANHANQALVVELARLPDRILGFGHVKPANAEAVQHDGGELLARYRSAGPTARRVTPVVAQKEPAWERT